MTTDSLKAILLQISNDSAEHNLSDDDVEAIWAMGLNSFLTAKGYGMTTDHDIKPKAQ
jgi:hypothetical protein